VLHKEELNLHRRRKRKMMMKMTKNEEFLTKFRINFGKLIHDG